MKKTEAFIVYRKELIVILRDRRTLFLAFILPILIYPFLILGMEKIRTIGEEKLGERKAVVAVEDPHRWLSERLEKEENILLRSAVEEEAARKAIGNRNIQAFLRVAEIEGGRKRISVFYDRSDDFSRFVYQKVEKVLDALRKEIRAETFRRKGYDSDPENLLRVSEVNLATDKQMGGFYLGKIVPFIIILLVISGGSISAFDLLAGEKERGTLETLLSTSIHRSSIIAGKFLVVLTTAAISTLLNLASLAVCFSLGLLDFAAKGKYAIPVEAIFFAVPILIPLAVLTSAALLLVSGYARSFKESQLYFFPVFLVCMVLAYVSLLPGVELKFFLSLVPVANVALAVKEIFVGRFAWQFLFLVFLSTSFYAYLLIRKTIPLLNREDILIPHEAEPTFQGAAVHQRAKRGFVFYVLLWLLMFYVAAKLQSVHVLWGLAITEYILILLPSILFAGRLGAPFRETFSLRLPSWRAWAGTVVMSISAISLMPLVVQIQNRFLPIPKSIEEVFAKAFDVSGLPWILALFLFSISPAICEEAMFRGVLTYCLKGRYSRGWLVLTIGIMFGVFHFSVYRLVPTAILGVLLTYVLLRTGSIYTSVLMHAVINGAALFVLSRFEPATFSYTFYVSMGILFLLSFPLLGREKDPS